MRQQCGWGRRLASGEYEKEATWTGAGELRCSLRFIGHGQQCNICNGKFTTPILTHHYNHHRIEWINIFFFFFNFHQIGCGIAETLGPPSGRSVGIRKIETVWGPYGPTETTELLSNVAIEIPNQVVDFSIITYSKKKKSHTRQIFILLYSWFNWTQFTQLLSLLLLLFMLLLRTRIRKRRI